VTSSSPSPAEQESALLEDYSLTGGGSYFRSRRKFWCDINASVACANIRAFAAPAFIPSELNAAVASVTYVT